MSQDTTNFEERNPPDTHVPPDPPDPSLPDEGSAPSDPIYDPNDPNHPIEDLPKKRNCGKTGPTSASGLARSSKNATKHGSCAWTLILSSELEENYLSVLAQWRAAYAPPEFQIAHIPPKIQPRDAEPPIPCPCPACDFETSLTYSMIVKVAQAEWHRIRNESNYNSFLCTTSGAMPFNWKPEQIKNHDLHLRYKTTAERTFQREFRNLLTHLKAQKDNLATPPTPNPQPEADPEDEPRTMVIMPDPNSPTSYTTLNEWPPRPGVTCPYPTPPEFHPSPDPPPKDSP